MVLDIRLLVIVFVINFLHLGYFLYLFQREFLGGSRGVRMMGNNEDGDQLVTPWNASIAR